MLALLTPGLAHAQSAPGDAALIQELRRQLQEMQRRLDALEARQAATPPGVPPRAAAPATPSASR
ncbi:MAG: hypothetical protein K2X74_23490, partial [Acetobacteraceae bacterium]|nr:hypothetical protein [Acetobacteraceae bacterium]